MGSLVCFSSMLLWPFQRIKNLLHVEAIVGWRQILSLPGCLREHYLSPLTFLLVQFEIFCVLQLEATRLFHEKNGTEQLSLPHVDNLTANTKKVKKGMDTEIIVTDLVLVGGGHSHVYVLKKMGMNPMAGVRVTLITRDVHTPYSGMLPGYVAGHYTFDECHIDLHRLCRFAKVNLIHAAVTNIDTVNQTISLEGRPDVRYNLLSINIGSSPRPLPNMKTVNTVPVKPISNFSSRWSSLLDLIYQESNGRSFNKKIKIIVVGGGAGGVELALSIQYRIKNELKMRGKSLNSLEMTILTKGKSLLGSHNKKVQKIFKEICEERNIKVGFDCEVVSGDKNKVICKDGREFECDHCMWCINAGTQDWLKESGLELDEHGFICVDENLQSVNTTGVFAGGDVAHMVLSPRPKAGVFAVRQGPFLDQNLRNRLLNLPLQPYHPQNNFLGIISTGDPRVSVASKGEMAMRNSWLWVLKDWIDKTWMYGYSEGLPNMEMEVNVPEIIYARGADAMVAFSEAQMRCGGCGAKVGATVLSNVMNRLRGDFITSDDCIIGLEAPDDCAVMKIPRSDEGELGLVSTVDFFRSFVNDPYIFGQVSAVHSLSDCHAINGQARTALAIAVVPYGSEQQVEESLFAMMAGAISKLNEANCVLVGGHSCEGIELSLGFTINGTVLLDKMLRKGGFNPGEHIILTKPIGTGALFAADMRGKAKGMHIRNALKQMVQMNEKAGQCLAKYNASTCTDVTGFGLLGHLNEMISASETSSVKINLNSVPILPGAIECIEQGITSSLQPQNTRIRRVVRNDDECLGTSSYALLFDPQTSGGLLASVPASDVKACLQELKEHGYKFACDIGEVVQYSNNDDKRRIEINLL